MSHRSIPRVPGSSVLGGLTVLALCSCGSTASTPPTAGSAGTGIVTSGGSGAEGATTGSGGVGLAGAGTVSQGGSGGNGNGATGATTTAATGGKTTGNGGEPSAAGAGGPGMSATGGTGIGGRSAGGRSSGGTSTGGATGGRPGSGNAGTNAAGGMTSTPPSGDPLPSAGCDATATTTSCNTQDSPCTMDVSGTARSYYVQLPDNYDPKHPYPVVFEYHPLGGNGWQGLTMYQIRPKMPSAIYVSPEGTTSMGSTNKGFPNTNGADETLTRNIMAELEGKYCVDKARYYATGFSYGGSMSYTAACNMSDVFRAIGAMSGAPISGATCTTKKPARPVAVWATHGDADTALPITMAQPIIDSLVKYNGCSSDTQPVDPSPCVSYQNCTDGYPVIWCVRPGDPHAIPSFAAAAIAKFFLQF